MYAGGAPDAGGRLPFLRLATGQVPATDHAAVALGAVQHHLAQREARLLHGSRATGSGAREQACWAARSTAAAGQLGSSLARGDAQRPVQAPTPRSVSTTAAGHLQCCDHASWAAAARAHQGRGTAPRRRPPRLPPPQPPAAGRAAQQLRHTSQLPLPRPSAQVAHRAQRSSLPKPAWRAADSPVRGSPQAAVHGHATATAAIDRQSPAQPPSPAP